MCYSSIQSADEYTKTYEEFVNFTSDTLVGLDHAPYAFDEVWALAIALDKADKDLKHMGEYVYKCCTGVQMESDLFKSK